MQRLSLSIFSLVVLAGSAGAQPAPDPQPAPPADPPPAQPEPSPAPASPPAAPAPVEVTPQASGSQVANKPDAPPSVSGKWTTSFYGFTEADIIYDKVQGATNGGGPTEALGNGALPRPASGTAQMNPQFRAVHDQTQVTARNSRLGFRLTAPTVNDIKPIANIEFDFAGNQPNTVSEASFYVNATMRIRHAYLKLETPFLDVVFGQTWQLFGWQPNSQAGSVQLQGLPGFLSSRAPQLRLGKTIKASGVTVDVQIAATRAGQRGGGLPDGVGGLRLAFDKLKAARIVGSAGSALDSAMVGVSVIGRRFNVTERKAGTTDTIQKNGYGLAINGLVPIIPATKQSKANALTLGGEFVMGAGTADLYTGLNGGVILPPTIPRTTMTFAPNIDIGLVGYLTSDGSVHPVRWQSYGAYAQYFLPPKGNVVAIVNYSHLSSDNAHNFNTANAVFENQDYVDGTLMFDVMPAVRFGAGFAWLNQTYVDGVEAHDYRGQLSGMFIF